jgi:hypothetical protein
MTRDEHTQYPGGVLVRIVELSTQAAYGGSLSDITIQPV